MSKEELFQELPNSSFLNNINAKLSDLSDRFNKFTSEYDKVYFELKAPTVVYLPGKFSWSVTLLLTLSTVDQRQLN